MNHGHTKESLAAFEQRVADAFLRREIAAPIHLSGGNEEQLLRIFEEVRPADWVFSGWRSHYHALLKGIPEERVFQLIMEGRSMYLSSKEHRFLCSAIVGGVLPIAAGVAFGIKRHLDMYAQLEASEAAKAERLGYRVPGAFVVAEEAVPRTVWVFVGDMTATTGLFHEFRRFCVGHQLPVRIVVEDNGYSTDTQTAKAWGEGTAPVDVKRYRYERRWPHVGVGKHVEF